MHTILLLKQSSFVLNLCKVLAEFSLVLKFSNQLANTEFVSCELI